MRETSNICDQSKWKKWFSLSFLLLLIFHPSSKIRLRPHLLNSNLNDDTENNFSAFNPKTETIKKRRLQLFDDDEFQARHERHPEELSKTVKGGGGDCTLKKDNLYGISSINKVEVPYSYEMEIEGRAFGSEMNQAIVAVERMINDSLTQKIFPWCKTETVKRQGTIDEQDMGFIDLTVQVQGITTEPSDSRDNNTFCQSEPTMEGSDCGLIIGGLSLYLGKNISVDEIDETVERVHYFIEENFRNGSYFKDLAGVIGISFASQELQSLQPVTASLINDPTKKEIDSTKSRALDFTVMSIIAFFSVVLTFFKAFLFSKEYDANA